MISRCANPDCTVHFDYRQGQFFRFHVARPEGTDPEKTHSVQHFWLCERCSGVYTLESRRREGVVIRVRDGQLSKADRFRRIAIA